MKASDRAWSRRAFLRTLCAGVPAALVTDDLLAVLDAVAPRPVLVSGWTPAGHSISDVIPRILEAGLLQLRETALMPRLIASTEWPRDHHAGIIEIVQPNGVPA